MKEVHMIGRGSKHIRKASTSRAALLSPLYTNNTSFNLGGEFVAGPKEAPAAGDPLKFAPFDLHKTAEGKAQRIEIPRYEDALQVVPEKPVTGVREAKVRKVQGHP